VDIIMKKTLLALSVLVASSAANAGIELYNQDDVSVTLGGDLEVAYVKNTTKDSNPGQDLQDADFSFDVRYAASDALSIGAFWEFSGDGGTADLGDAYFGFYTADMGELKIGKTATILDDAGVGSDYQFGIKKFIDNVGFGGSETVKYKIDTGMVYAGIAYQGNQGDNAYSSEMVLDTDPTSTTYNTIIEKETNAGTELVDMNIGVRFAGLDLVAFYGHAGSLEKDTWAVEARYGIDAVNLELGYYDVEKSASTIAFAVDYSVEAWKFAAGISDTDYEEVGKKDLTAYFVNAGYSIAPSTTVYAEIGGVDTSGTDTAYAVGIKADF
jgi:predicted porin